MMNQNSVEDGHDCYEEAAPSRSELDLRRNKKKKTSESKSIDSVEILQDAFVVFGVDVMSKILGYLDAHSLARSLMVSRSWKQVASSDAIWSKKCEELWDGKAHLPRMSQTNGLSKLAAYTISIMHSKSSRICKEDLWDHSWEFHFKKETPEYWQNLDPYWTRTGPLMRRYFHPDGSQTADPEDKVWGGHECCYTVVTSLFEDERIREHYVRIGRWPEMSISRTGNWGWRMSNHLFSYSSIPDADKKGGTGPYG